MAPRANWKGYLRLSLVSCPILLYPATSESEKIRFHMINKATGHRVRIKRVDEKTGEEVPYKNVVKGYEVSKGHYIEITDEELEAIALESTRTIEIDKFVPKQEIDELYNIRPYYIAPNGKMAADAFAVIRDVIERMKMVALGRVVLSTREHVIALEQRDNGIVGTLLRYPYEIHDASEYFKDIPSAHITKDMLELAAHIVETKSGHFNPKKFEDHYERALRELIEKKRKGEKIEVPTEARRAKVVNLMDALRRTVEAGESRKPPALSRRARGDATAKRTTRATTRRRKAS